MRYRNMCRSCEISQRNGSVRFFPDKAEGVLCGCVNSRMSLPFVSHGNMCNSTAILSAENWLKEKGVYVSIPRVSPRPPSPHNKPLMLLSQWRKLTAMGFFNRTKRPHLPPWFVIQWTASLKKWIHWRALCREKKGRPLPRRCHLPRDAIINTQLWEKGAEKTFTPV